jgi:hypothetical protein
MLNYAFQIFTHFRVAISVNWMSYIDKIGPIHFGFDHVTIAVWLVSLGMIVLNILHRSMAYAVSDYNNIDSV